MSDRPPVLCGQPERDRAILFAAEVAERAVHFARLYFEDTRQFPDLTQSAEMVRSAVESLPVHRHHRSCYDDPGPAHGRPVRVCDKVAGLPEVQG